MSRYLECYEIYKEMMLEITQQRVKMKTLICLVLSSKLEPHRQIVTPAILKKMFTKTFIVPKSLNEICYEVIANISKNKTANHIKKHVEVILTLFAVLGG